MEGGAKNEEHAARGTNDMRTQYAMQIVVCLAAGLVLAGCGNLAKTTRPEGLVAASQADPNLDLTITVPPRASDLDNEQYDPWESFNEKMFTFNYNVDKYALKPVPSFVPFVGQVGRKVGDTVNDRALNYDLFAGVEATTIALYSSVRHFYLKRREQMIEE